MFPFGTYSTEIIQFTKNTNQFVSIPVAVAIPTFNVPITNYNIPCPLFTNANNINLMIPPQSFCNDLQNKFDQIQQMNDNLIQKTMKTNYKSQIKKFNDEMLDLIIDDFYKNKKNNDSDSTISSNSSKNKRNIRSHFTKEEDEKIKELVNTFGTKNWSIIASLLEGRTAKQCRDRYSNYLIPGYFQGEWSNEEDKLLLKLYKKFGSKWSIIQTYFPIRSSNSIKNRWHYFLRKNDKLNLENDDEIDLIDDANDIENTKDDENESRLEIDLGEFELINEEEEPFEHSSSATDQNNNNNEEIRKFSLNLDIELKEKTPNIFDFTNELLDNKGDNGHILLEDEWGFF
ncbi:Myb- protein B [Tritrichomonas musculus]|uniref:Myb- protein B n=1 Tax=Tritrichomonas musculus TaxID=1915356 RepID=A0ABR2IQH4_9EUKA